MKSVMLHVRASLHASILLLGLWICSFSSLALATEGFQETSGQVVIEAEHYDVKIPRNSKDWVLETEQSGYSGTGYLTALPNTGKNQNRGYLTKSPELIYNVRFTTIGTYYVWVRGYAATGSDDSIHAGIDGTGPSSAERISSFSRRWTWSQKIRGRGDSATVIVPEPGFHTIHLWMRKDGFKVDKILLRTNSSSTVPSGLGPAESPRTETASAGATAGLPPETTPPTNAPALTSPRPSSLDCHTTDCAIELVTTPQIQITSPLDGEMIIAP